MPSQPSPIVREAESLARRLLAEDSDRFAHCRYAASIAELTADALGMPDCETLVAAAWLHDIGYAPSLAMTGFHPLDGALHLASAGWPDDTVLLVAHHAHADVLARYYGVENQLAVLDHASGEAEDILTYADLRSGPTGMGATPEQRIGDMRRHQGSQPDVPVEVSEGRNRLLLAAAARVSAAVNSRPNGWSSRRRSRAVGVSGSRLGA